jgi:hypothetical protein
MVCEIFSVEHFVTAAAEAAAAVMDDRNRGNAHQRCVTPKKLIIRHNCVQAGFYRQLIL